jgi:glycosyltransferase involved in cell wall biosynthesis
MMISIIVPVYNVAAYVEECLQSIAGQDFDHPFETILVDDASTDNSADICRRFIERNPAGGFCLLENPDNRGVSVARNLGLAHARGRYLMFVDPDDRLPPAALSALFEAAERNRADIVKGNLVLFDDRKRRPAPDRVRRPRLVRGEDVLSELFEHSTVRGHVGGKLFRRDRFGTIRFTVGVRMAQDLLYFSEVFAAAGSLLLTGHEVYEYRKHGTGSTGRKYEKGSYIDWLGAVETSRKFARTPGQKRAHKKLLLRTMAQIARECRHIPADSAAVVLSVIEQKCRQWKLGMLKTAVVDRLGLRAVIRYIKLQLALRQIRRNLSRS